MIEKDTVLCAVAELELALKPLSVPCILVIGLPSTGEFIHLANGLEQDGNRGLLALQILDLLAKFEVNGGAA